MRRPVAALAVALCVAFLAPFAHAHGDTVNVVDGQVSPEVLTVPVGTVVHFQNAGEAPASCTIVADDDSWQSPTLAQGAGWHQRFPFAGTYPFHLEEHPAAKGKIVVEPAP
jgi:plastocyanin